MFLRQSSISGLQRLKQWKTIPVYVTRFFKTGLLARIYKKCKDVKYNFRTTSTVFKFKFQEMFYLSKNPFNPTLFYTSLYLYI